MARDGVPMQMVNNHDRYGKETSHGEIQEVMAALDEDERAKAQLHAEEKPDDEKGIIAAYVNVAEQMGFDITAEELEQGMKILEQDRIAKTEQATSVLSEISMEELDRVAGGDGAVYDHFDDSCDYTYKDYENCWFQDACDMMILYHGNLYKCKNQNAD